MKFPEFGVRLPVTNIMIFFSILILGMVSLDRLPVDMMPEIEMPGVSVITIYDGAGAQDVESKVTEVIENNLSTVANLDRITSRSLENLSTVTCRFKWGTNLDEASNDIRDKLEFAKRMLPDEIETPIVFKFNTAMMPIMFMAIDSSDVTYPNLYHILDKQVSDKLKRIPDIGSVQIFGGLERQINVKVDRIKLEAYRITPQTIIDRLAKENITLPAGDLKTGYIDYTLRVPGEFTSPEQIKNVIVYQDSGKVVYLRDIALVEDAFKEETMFVRNNRKQGMMMMVQKRSGGNTVEVVKQVRKSLEQIKPTLPKDINISILMDQAEHIERSINDLSSTVYWGGLFVILVVFFFLREWRSSFIIALTIPFSLIIAFIVMYFLGYTINVMSLTSLALGIGMVVDNAIVVVDNVMRHRERGQKPKEAAIYGSDEVGLAVSASTFTTVVVFLPMVFLSGITGIMFKQLAIIVTTTLLASLFTALTFTPMLCSKMLTVLPEEQFKKSKARWYKKFYEHTDRFLNWLDKKYADLLALALRHKTKTVLIAVGFFAASLIVIPLIGTEFIPEEDTGDFNVQVELPVGTRVEVSDAIARQMEDIFEKNIPELEMFVVRTGQSSGSAFGSAMGQKTGSNVVFGGGNLVKLDKRKRSAKEIGEAIRPKLEALTGVKKVSVTAGSPFARMLFGGGKPISLEILGHSLEDTDKLAYDLKNKLSKIPGLTDISISRELGKPELAIEVDREKASSLGLSMAGVTDTLRIYLYGKTASRYREGGEQYDIFVQLDESSRSSIKDIEEIPLYTPSGKVVPLSNVAKIYNRAGPIEIARQNQERVVKVEANIFKRDLGSVAKDVRKMIGGLKLPENININLGSDVEEQGKAFRDLFLLFFLSIILVYMVMASQFESLRDPFVIMFSVPFAWTGVAFGLLLGGVALSIVSFLGLVMLVGIVVNNAIVLVDFINILRNRGMKMHDAVVAAGASRLRPIMMTTITTMFGMLPLAASMGEGSEIWRPIGISMIGGLFFSTLITLVLVPTLYTIFEKTKNGKKKSEVAA